jgi:ATP-binding cassette, subfamily C, bacterial CydC
VERKPVFIRLIELVAPFAGWIFVAVLCGAATVGSGVGLMATAAWIIAGAALHPSIADLQVAIVGVRFFGIARGVFRYLERYVSHQVTFRLLARLRVWFYTAIEPLAPARLMQYRSGDLLARVVADIETLENLYVRGIAPPIVAVIIGALMWVFMDSLARPLALALLALMIAVGLGVSALTLRLSRAAGRRRVTARGELNATLVDSIQGAAELVAFGQEAAWLERAQSQSRALVKAQERIAWVGGLHGALGNLAVSLAALVVLVIAIPLVNSAQIPGVYLAALVLAAMASLEAVLPLPLAAQYLESTLEAARRLFDVVDVPPAVPRSVAESTTHEPRPASYDLRVENLRFRYGPDEPPALDGVDFTLPQGKRLTIVGPSGAGKSTLVNLLLRFWDYEQGTITLGGRDVRAYDPDDLRRLMGVVSQNTYLFNATIRDNLLIAKPKATTAELEQSVRRAQLEPFIQSLPQGYDTWIGEQGLRLSGGERQRLAIARALVKDAPILILDEPTANLDTLTEREVMQSIRLLMEGRTTLLITHRLVGLEDADEILVLQAGRVAERGSHAELMGANGLYCRMWQVQNQSLTVA